MAQKARNTEPKLGRHFLSVALLGDFLGTPAALAYDKTKAIYERCLKGQQTHEVTVVSVNEEGIATCTFFARGGFMEAFNAPISCLKVIKPVSLGRPQQKSIFSELDRLMYVG
ncbi:MAG: hypothetical protein WC791_03850 [Candidatus Paceibacterota bacterium]|jgi:hypothetical protein